MKTIKVTKTTEEMPLKEALELCLKVLRRPADITEEEWVKQIREDLISGKKFFRIRELVLSRKTIDND